MLLGDLKTHLTGFTDITDKIGERVYINRAPSKTRTPYVIVSTVSGEPQYALSGEAGIAQAIVQVSVWDQDPNGVFVADEVAELIRDKMSGWRGSWGDTYVSGCTLTNEPTAYGDNPADSSDDWWHTVQQDFRVTHRRAVPTLS